MRRSVRAGCSWPTPERGNAAAAGVMQLMFGGESRHAVDFDVQRYAGCYFVRF